MAALVSKSKCIGCGACADVCPKNCISMYRDNDGFLYPEVDVSLCVNCEICESVCPISDFNLTDIYESPVAVAAYNNKSDVLRTSSSGGVFTDLAENVIFQGGVVYGVAFCEDFSVAHIRIDTAEKISLLRGSKYLQSDIGISYCSAKNDLKAGLKVLFTGTPCQVAGLKKYLGKDYENLICVDIICHSVPSPKAWRRFLHQFESRSKQRIVSANFRDKRDSWKRYCLSVKMSDGCEAVYSIEDNLYMKAFINGLSTREACYNCKFKGQNRGSDITVGDFWGIENVCPEFLNDKGTSLVLLQSDKGKQFFEAVSQGLSVKSVDGKQALENNPAYYQTAKPHKNRSEFFNRLDAEPFDNLVQRLLASEENRSVNRIGLRSFISRVIRKIKRTVSG